jgi:aminopeptidase N
VGNDEENEAWLDEGFATYAQELYEIERLGHSYQVVRSSFNFKEPGVPLLTPSAHFTSLGTYANAMYTKGSGILWMLRGMLGKNKFDQALRAYFEKLKFKNATTSDLVTVIEEISGQKLGWFFDQWLRTTKTIDIAVQNVSSVKQANGSIASQATVTRSGAAVMPVRIQFVLSDGSKLEELWDGQSSEKAISFETQQALVRVMADPDQDLLEINRTNNTGFAQTRAILNIASLGFTE